MRGEGTGVMHFQRTVNDQRLPLAEGITISESARVGMWDSVSVAHGSGVS